MADKYIKKLADVLCGLIFDKRERDPEAYDTTATVRRIENGKAYVHIPGGVDETPVDLTIDAAAGDTVQVRVSGGRAWLVGNRTAPPTDDTTARVAQNTAAKAEVRAEQAEETANAVNGIANSALAQAAAAKQIADDTEQHFWFTETGTDTGAHITEVPQEEWEDASDPNYHAGGNLLARTNGMAVRDGTTELASFGANGIQIGQDGVGHVVFEPAKQKFVLPDGYVGGTIDYFYDTNYGIRIDDHVDFGTAAYAQIVKASSGPASAISLVARTEASVGGAISILVGDNDIVKSKIYIQAEKTYIQSDVDVTGDVTASGGIDVTGKATLGAINGDSLFDYSTVSMTSSSISANASGEVTSSASNKTNYYPIAITNVNISTGQASLRRFYFSTQQSGKAVVKIGLQNDGTSAKTISVSADILWVKIAV